MIYSYFLVLTGISPIFAQVAISYGIRPDVHYDGTNSRFDVSNIMKYNKKHFLNEMDTQSDEYRRRNSKKQKSKSFKDATFVQDTSDNGVTVNDNQEKDKNSWIDVLSKNIGNKYVRNNAIENLENHVNQLANKIINKLRSMRRFEDFAHHDDMDSIGEADFEENLQSFRAKDRQGRRMDLANRLHGFRKKRRNIENAERELLLHYGFPVNMKIEGFLQKP